MLYPPTSPARRVRVPLGMLLCSSALIFNPMDSGRRSPDSPCRVFDAKAKAQRPSIDSWTTGLTSRKRY